jgi:hypothetical protein
MAGSLIMATATLEERYAANLHGVLSCFDRMIIVGTLPGACYAEGMTSYLYVHGTWRSCPASMIPAPASVICSA